MRKALPIPELRLATTPTHPFSPGSNPLASGWASRALSGERIGLVGTAGIGSLWWAHDQANIKLERGGTEKRNSVRGSSPLRMSITRL
jgi:hypothetical protein